MEHLTAISALRPERAETVTPAPAQAAHLRKMAEDFEAAFLGEMLRHTGLGQMSESFNGGAGEMQFSGFLTDQYAAEIAATGRIGIADQVYRSLMQRAGL